MYKFDGEGEPLDFEATGTNFIEGTGGQPTQVTSQIAIAPQGSVGGTEGDIYVAGENVLQIYSSAGLEIGHLGASRTPICGVATDSAGDVFTKTSYVDEHEGVTAPVLKYTPTTNPVAAGDLSGESISIPGACNLALAEDGAIYTSGTFGEQSGLLMLPSLNAAAAQKFAPPASTVAAEPGTGDVYAASGAETTEYAADGSVLTSFGEGRLADAKGVSVAGTGGSVYVSNEVASPFRGRVEVYGPLVQLPDTVAGTAATITKTSAELHGTIDADGGPQATCEFQYTTEAAFEAERFEGANGAACAPNGPFSGESTETVGANVSGLRPGTRYRFRLVGTNKNGSLASDENGSAPGGPPSFETVPAFGVSSGAAADLTTTSATLTGSINPEGIPLDECFFEFEEAARTRTNR